MKELVKNVENDILEIFPQLPNGGLVINNEQNNATMQIYGIKTGQNSIIRSNLAYLDLSRCLEKIYSYNEMKEDEDIVVIKLDLKTKNPKLVINPIEYEFVNSKTGERLDITACERNEVIISYPLTYYLKTRTEVRNLDEDVDEEEKKREISDKFERGKLLYEKDNSIDSFNYNSTIYSNICYPLVIDGKDLTLEDRISYFYPNYSFCETFCVYDYTNFNEERVYCNCTLKYFLEIDRPHGVRLLEFNETQTNNNQSGPTNVPVLKCLMNIKITSNPGFYYSIIFFIIEFILLFVIIFQGISALNKRMQNKLFKSTFLPSFSVSLKIS